MTLPRRLPAQHRSKPRKALPKKHLRKAFFETLEDRRVMATAPLPLDVWAQHPYADDRLVVQFVEGTSDADRAAVLEQTGLTQTEYWDDLRIAITNLPGEGQNVVQVAELVNAYPQVQFVEPDFKVDAAPQSLPNDTLFPLQWSLNNTGQTNVAGTSSGIFGADISADEAWDFTNNRENVVAVIDTGVQISHPDLKDHIWTNPGEVFDGIDNDNNGYVDDVYGWDFDNQTNDPNPSGLPSSYHGTHVAGIVAAVQNNNLGVSGVSPNTKIMALKALEPLTIEQLVTGTAGAIRYATMMKVKYGVNVVAINNSYYLPTVGYSYTVYTAIKAASDAGINFVSAAGNFSLNNDNVGIFPANYRVPGALNVAATDRNDDLAYFSNYGPASVDIGAPGVEVLSTFPTYELTTSGYNGYEYLSGTSMASPTVAGAVAFLRSLDPSLTPEETREILMRTADALPSLEYKAIDAHPNDGVAYGGRLNLGAAVQALPHVSINGVVFEDINGNGARNGAEGGLKNFIVYIDKNNNGRRDANEPFARTDVTGAYSLNTFDGAGTYHIGVQAPRGFVLTYPSEPSRTLVANDRSASFNNTSFGFQRAPGRIVGKKLLDVNNNGRIDAADRGMGGVKIFVDLNNNGVLNVGEPFTITAPDGTYVLGNIPAGTHTLREEITVGVEAVSPIGGSTTITVGTGKTTVAPTFLNARAYDFGDAPRPYPVVRASNGAQHAILQGFSLGTKIDREANGQISAAGSADRDDTTGLDDEDGLTFQTLVAGQRSVVRVTASNNTGEDGYFQLWIDFNNNGKWEEGTEHVFKNVVLQGGKVYNLRFTAPADMAQGTPIYARARYSHEQSLKPTGFARDGEVEDYQLDSIQTIPIANDDPNRGVYTVLEDSAYADNKLNVLANDTAVQGRDPQLIPRSLVTKPKKGTVRLNKNGTPDDRTDDFYEYRPNPGATGADSFTYRAYDKGKFSNIATVSINITPKPPEPIIPVDDFRTVYVDSRFADNVIDVRANDLGEPYAAAITNVVRMANPADYVNGNPPAALGRMQIFTNGNSDPSDDVLRYQPNAGASGIERYEYELTDSLGRVTTAFVTVQINDDPGTGDPGDSTRTGALAELQAEPTLDGTTPLTEAHAGDTFYVTVWTRDTRTDVPGDGFSDYGIKAATADLLYDSKLFNVLSVSMQNYATPADINYNFSVPSQDPTQNNPTATPGLINEVGGLNKPDDVTGLPRVVGVYPPNRFVLYKVQLQVKDNLDLGPTGQTTTNFYVDPADERPFHRALWIDPNSGNPEATGIGDLNINFIQFSNFTVFASPSPAPALAATVIDTTSGTQQLLLSVPVNADINRDNVVDTLDVLEMVHTIKMNTAAAQTGGTQSNPPEMDLDGDGHLTFTDMLKLINEYKKSRSSASGESSTSTTAQDYASSVDSVFGDDSGNGIV